LLLITDLEIGGTPTVVRELALRLRRPGEVHVEVACLSRWGPVARQLDEAGVPVIALGATRATQLPRVVRRVRRLVRDGQIDTVISFLVHASVVAALASNAWARVRLVQSIQTTQPTPRWHWWVQRFAQRAADCIVVPSRAVARIAADRCDDEPVRIPIIPNAIDSQEFARANVFRTAPLRIGFLGRLDPVKRVDALIRAVARLNDEPIECHIFGDGPQRAALERLARSVGMSKRIFFHGQVEIPQDALGRMDVLVLPSRHEGFGLVLIEAMAAGIPVIAAAGGGALDVVRHRVNGLLVDPDDPEPEIAARILDLMRDGDLRNRLIEGGLRTVREKFSWDVVLPQYRRLLQLD
jgi:glycosyltransferase involved in cell wall biosynthesis